jgi:hypothetical protein
LRAILGLLLIPVCVALTRSVLSLVVILGSAPDLRQSWPALVLGAGVLLWTVLFSVLPKPVRSYVLAHELTHAFWAAITGADVSGLKVSRGGGSVKVSEVNWLTALAPYFFPFYTVLVVLLYGLLALFLNMRGWEWVWLGLIGLTLGFHWTFTLDSLAQPQSDIQRYGRLFSYPLIYLFNLMVVGLVLVLAGPVTFSQFGERLLRDLDWIWRLGYQAVEMTLQWGRLRLAGFT